MAITVGEITWLQYLFADLHLHQSKVPVLYCDNNSALHLTVNHVFHARTKHIEIDYYYLRELVARHLLETRFIPSSE